MTDSHDQDRKKVLSLSGRGRLELKSNVDAGQVRQSFSHGRSKQVQVEVKRKRTFEKPGAPADGGLAARRAAEGGSGARQGARPGPRTLTQEEREARARAVRGAILEEEMRRHVPAQQVPESVEDLHQPPESESEPVILDAETRRRLEEEERRQIEEEERRVSTEAEAKFAEEEAKRRAALDATRRSADARRGTGERGAADRGAGDRTATPNVARPGTTEEAPALRHVPVPATEDDEEGSRRRGVPGAGKKASKPAPSSPRKGERRNAGKVSVTQALDGDDTFRGRSVAAMRRRSERERMRHQAQQETQKVVRDVVLPEVITVQELANRMAERGADVIKTLMRMGVMATINQTIDADTAELVINEFGHRVRRVSEADVELGLHGQDDTDATLVPRPPVVTIMGHVDHGKTSLLDALRHTDVAAGEAGGITQHIGAYQVMLENGSKITFIDTPGHAAFTEMRARGANVTDVVVLVVASNDGVMPQTIEAIQHAKAAEVPIIVAINKIDLPDAKPERVKQELLQHGIVVEEMGGDVLAVPVSAKTRQGLDKLEEAIMLQAEILELRANPNRAAEGVVVEAKLDKGRGNVATVLIQRGTLHVGDIFVTGSEWGRVRALMDDRGRNVQSAGPGQPVEVLGLQGAPLAGDDLVVVDTEARAREVAEFRLRRKRQQHAAVTGRTSLQDMFAQIKAGEVKEFPVVVKGDVQGSIEAISGALEKLAPENSEVRVRVLHAAVGAVNESDVTLANASRALIIGFNVRANPQARELAKRDGVEIRYYSVIYNVLDDVRAALTGLLSPTLRENFLGNAQIREVFNITKVGKVAGCMVTEGVVKRGAKVRLLRDNVVIHEGTLKTLKRFKDEVKEVREGYECGMAFENYDDIRPNDVIEAFEIEEVARQL